MTMDRAFKVTSDTSLDQLAAVAVRALGWAYGRSATLCPYESDSFVVRRTGYVQKSRIYRQCAVLQGVGRQFMNNERHGRGRGFPNDHARNRDSDPASSYERRLWPLVFLAPDIQQAILEGRQPPALTLDQLLKMQIPTGWPEQRRTLCFNGN